jgi:uncharacterized protein DUF3467
MDVNEIVSENSGRRGESAPVFYADSVDFNVNIYSFTLDFSQMNSSEEPNTPQCSVKMSPQHAKTMMLLLAKNVRCYEERVGIIALPDKLLDELGIEEE